MSNYFSNKIYNINFLMIMMIVILHSSCLRYINDDNIYIINIYKFINTICDAAVPAFFCISAYLFYRNFELTDFKFKFHRRLKSLVIPYFLWSIILYIYYKVISFIPIVNDNFNMSFDLSTNKIIPNILLATCAETMWFVRILFIFVLISPIIYILLKTLKEKSIFVLVFFLLFNLKFDIGYSDFLFWIPIYFLGAYCAIFLKDRIEKNSSNKKNKLSFFLLNLFLFLLIAFICSKFNEYSKIYYLYRMISPILLILVLDYPCVLGVKKFAIASTSFFIFCIHLPIIQIIRKVLLLIFGNDSFISLFVFIFTIIITTVISIYLYKIFKNFFPRLLNLLTGGR